jgi:hypothetical protein
MAKTRSITDMVRDGRTAKFAYFRDGSLWYETQCGFFFEIPAEDTGSATFRTVEKALTLMRWIRRQVVANVKAEANQNS